MSRIDGIIILSPNGKPLISSHFSSHPPSYPNVHIDAYNHAVTRNGSISGQFGSSDEPRPILWVNTLVRGGGLGNAGLCHLEREGLTFLVPISQEVNPLLAFTFLERFLETLKDYLGEVTETTLKDNFDIVYMLIEEMLDEGHVAMTELAMLKEIVLPPSLMRKLLSVAGVSGLQTPTTTPLVAPIPWRRTHVRHPNNEIYFDVEETLDAIVDRKGNVLSSSVWGRINANSRLSGTPDLLLTLIKPDQLSNCSFHPCIRYNRWNRDKVLSFIPPDGKFKLLEYQAADLTKGQLPFLLSPSMTLEENGGRFSLTIMSRLNNRPLENLIISINLGEGASSVSATATGDRRPIGHGGLGKRDDMSEGMVGGGVWEFDPNTRILRWTISSLTSTEKPPTLTGSFVTTSTPIPSPSFAISYDIPNYVYSGLKIDQLRVLGEMYKPFKGVRMTSVTGRVEVRY